MSGQSELGCQESEVAALILAAGASRRMGSPKALLPWGGRSLLRHVAEVALASPCRETFVVLGAEREQLARELHGLELQRVENEAWERGMGSSLAAGIRAVEAAEDPRHPWRAVLILLCDQPAVTPALLARLIALADESAPPAAPRRMVACRYANSLGPPALFERSLFGELRALTGDRGAKALLLRNPEAVASVDFAEGALDLDTPEDYERAREETP